MKKLQPRTFLVLLTLGLGTTAALSGQVEPGMSSGESQPTASRGSTANSVQHAGGPKERVPSIFSAEEIPAFLITDPCDTTDY